MFNFKAVSRPFVLLILMYVLWLAAGIFVSGLFEIYLSSHGVSILELLLIHASSYVLSIVTIPLFSKLNYRKFLLFGVIQAIVATSILLLWPGQVGGLLFKIIFGASNFFFWVPFNIYFYSHRKENIGALSSLYFNVGASLSIILPTIGGLVASQLGYAVLYLLAIALYVCTFVVARLAMKSEVVEYSLASSLVDINQLKTLIFLEGFCATIISAVFVKVFLLYFIKLPLEFGAFVSLITVFSIIATWIIGRYSDKKKSRKRFLVISVFGFAVSGMAASFSDSLSFLFASFSGVTFFNSIFSAQALALTMDNSKDVVKTMIGREFMLNVGRFFGIILALIIFIFADIRTALFIQSALLLTYLAFLEKKQLVGT